MSSGPDEFCSQPPRAVILLVLERVPDFMRCYRNRRQGAPMVLVFGQSHGFGLRVVVIAFGRYLDGN